MQSFWLAFLTGLTTGGFSCLAVQGGLLTSSLASNKTDGDTQSSEIPISQTKFISFFLVAKIVSYTILGVFLGQLGSMMVLSVQTQAYLQIAVGLFMFATVGRLLNIHPIFRYFVLQPPKQVFKLLRRVSKEPGKATPILLGAFTVLIPCGVTQAMMVAAVATGSPVLGGVTMFGFTLGTSPIFFALGMAAARFMQHKAFSYIASAVIVYFAVLSVNGGLVLSGSPYTLQNFYKAATTDVASQTAGSVAGVTEDGKQDVTITVTDHGYSSSATTLKAGKPVKLSLITNNVKGCARSFTIPSFNMVKSLPETGTEVVEFTPKKTGKLAYTCAMGMYEGTFDVIP